MKLKKVVIAVISLMICCGFLMPCSESNDSSFSISVSAESTGVYSNNISEHDYTTYGKIVDSYLYEDSDSNLVRVENLGDRIIVEKYSDYTNVESFMEIETELEYFCGFYAGSDANYIVFGAKNTDESDDVEVIRVVKYSKEWKRISSCAIKGINTYSPCSFGSLDMAESDGNLIIHTCHTMYKSSDGLNHQANMTFVIDEENMECTQSYTDIMNISIGYCSHSFNQYVDTDGQYIYRVDHGDAYPRGIAITRAPISSITNVDYEIVYDFAGQIGSNYTDASVGGLSVMEDTCLVAFATYDQQSDSDDKTHNIYLSAVSKDMSENELIQITNYTSDDYVTVTNPYIIKYDTDKSLLMWEEYGPLNNYIGTKIYTVDGKGNIIETAMDTGLRLSDCKPILGSDGYIKWYVTNNSSPCFNVVNPNNLNQFEDGIKGDLDNDMEITTADALIILQSVTQSINLDYNQNRNADLSGDGKITSLDALIVLQYIVGIVNEL